MEDKFRVLVLGDVMLDQYTYVRTRRQAEEARIPIWDETKNEYRLGGAANVANNLAAIGGDQVEVHLAGICGSGIVSHMLGQSKILSERVMGHQTMIKRRFVDLENYKFVMRLDNFQKFDHDEIEFFEMMMNYCEQDFDAVIFSDYDKGTVTQAVVDVFKKCTPVTLVDSKREDLRIFSGMDVLKVNENEYSNQVSSKLYPNFVEFFKNCVVTKGDRGADLIVCERREVQEKAYLSHSYVNHTENFPAPSANVRDVTGCGDTHTAAMAFAFLKTKDIRSAVKFANSCASQVVQKFGTSVALSTDRDL